MGIYLNPRGITKEGWLRDHAREVDVAFWTWENRQPGEMPLCAVSGNWTAVLICYFRREMDRARVRPGVDERPRRYFFAPISEVRKQPDLQGLEPAIRKDAGHGFIRDVVELWDEAG
jgi:hypothetical protein